MSAFVIDQATMTRALRGIFAAHPMASWSGQIVPEFCGDCTSYGDRRWIAPTMLGRRLFALNIEAVQQRYPDCRADPSNMPGFDGCEYMASRYEAPASLIGARCDAALLADSLKALQCLIYQCSEGNVPETAEYQALKAAESAIAIAIAEAHPAYARARW